MNVALDLLKLLLAIVVIEIVVVLHDFVNRRLCRLIAQFDQSSGLAIFRRRGFHAVELERPWGRILSLALL
jgi:hypothetical protein